MKQWTAQVQYDQQKNAYVLLPQEMLDSLGWKEGDQLIFTIKDDHIILHKDSDTTEQATDSA